MDKIPFDIDIVPEPFIAGGLSGEEVILNIMDAQNHGIIRRFGAVVKHDKAGYTFNAMIVWNLPDDKIDEVGTSLSELEFISHCYRRTPLSEWPFNLYTMIHAKNEDEAGLFVDEVKRKISKITECPNFKILETVKEHKKTSFEPF